MITPYTADVSHWADWQQEYRFGVLLIFPPEPLLTQVNTLRARYDPQSQATCDVPITLSKSVRSGRLRKGGKYAHW